MNKGTKTALIALALVGVSSVLLSYRLTALDAVDVADEQEIVVTEAVSEAHAAGRSRAEVVIGTLDRSDAVVDLTARVCSDQLTLSADQGFVVESRPEVGDPRRTWQEQPITSGASHEDYEDIESLEDVDFSESAIYLPDGCIGFHRRKTEPGGSLVLSWPTNLFGDGADEAIIEVSRTTRAPLSGPDRGIVGLFFLVAIVLLIAGQVTTAHPGPPKWTGWQATGVMGAFLAASVVFGMIAALGAGGPLSVYIMMLAITITYLGTAVWLAWNHVPWEPLAALAFHRISRSKFVAAAGFGFAAAILAVALLSWVPRGESEMTRILEPSSGLLRVAAMALIAPWAEELLLRGVLYGALERKAGPIAAVIGSASVFSILHFAQHLGSLGPWLVVTVTGLILSMVRWYTGSTVGSTVSHLVYNACLIVPALAVG